MLKLTLAQRARRLPRYCSDSIWMLVVRASSDLREANKVPAWAGGKEHRRLAMHHMACSINLLRRIERTAGLTAS
jgi:hypothetical protein